jgi:uncharacterized protein (TIGR03067 family)
MTHGVGLKRRFALICLALAVSGTSARPDDPAAKAAAELQGCWKLISFEINGQSRDPLGGGEPRWVIKGDKVFYGGEEALQLVPDPDISPKVIDVKFRDPDRVYEGIYVIEKDTLKICLNSRADAKERPDAFSTKDRPTWRLLVFEREKAAPANPIEGLTSYAGVQLRFDAEKKTVVIEVPIKGGPAEKVGLKQGDVILKVGGVAVTDLEGTVNAIRQAKPGAKLELQISRDGKEMTFAVTVGVLPVHYTALILD